jgi:hypothetical protein
MDTRRIKTLTPKGNELYRINFSKYYSQTEKIWNDIRQNLQVDIESINNLSVLESKEHRLSEKWKHYTSIASKFKEFLLQTSTEDSLTEYEAFNAATDNNITLIEEMFEKIESRRQNIIESQTNMSCSSRRTDKSQNSSNLSARSSTLARRHAKAEAARARLEFVEKQNEILKEQAKLEEDEILAKLATVRRKAKLDADLSILCHQKDVAAAETEVNALRSSVDNESITEFNNQKAPSINEADRQEMTQQYVQQQVEQHQQVQKSLNPEAPPYNPHNDTQITSEFTRFLLKKDLLFARLSTFNDKPETYRVWRSSFRSVIDELQVNEFEQLDLLVKWLGPTSSKHAMSMRSANVNNPKRGLERLWTRLDERYGSPEMIESVLKSRLTNFPRLSNRDNIKLYELSDILSEILCVKNQDEYSSLLAYFDSSVGVKPVVEKLPYSLQEKWTTRAARYKTQHKTSFPPFSFFVDFVAEMSRVKNDPSFIYMNNSSSTTETRNTKTKVFARKTEVSSQYKEIDSPTALNCAIHGTSHRLSKCREFISKPLEARKDLLRQKGLCFKCCDFQHTSRNCREIIKCQDCGNNRHVTAMHGDVPTKSHGGETPIKSTNFPSKQHSTTIVNSSCTEVCKDSFYGKSCAKILPVFVYPKGQREKSTKMYVMLDDQSNRSLARSAFFDLFKVNSRPEEYIMSSCSGKMTTSGRRASEFVIESCSGELTLELPTLIECDNLPDNRHEIPTSDVAKFHPHLHDIIPELEPLDDKCQILLLIGRDLPYVHRVLAQRTSLPNAPIAQKSPLGWTIMGEMCLGNTHLNESVNVYKTFVMPNGRTSLLKPCENKFTVKEQLSFNKIEQHAIPSSEFDNDTIFERTTNDDKPGLSVEDRLFLQKMDKELDKDDNGNWVAPLPFKDNRSRLPDNRFMAMRRAKTFDGAWSPSIINKWFKVVRL